MADISIQKTFLGTSNPLDLDKGIATDPDWGTLRHSWHFGPDTLIDKSLSNSVMKLGLKCVGTFDLGVSGPAYAMQMDAEGDLDSNGIQLAMLDPQFQAGMILGADLLFEVGIDVEHIWAHWVWHGWHSHLAKSWKSTLDKTYPFRFDLLTLIIAGGEFVAKYLIPGGKTIVALIPQSEDFKGLWDQHLDFTDSDGNVTLHPQVIGDIDLVNLGVLLVADGVEGVQPELIPFVEIFKELYKITHKIRLTISTGPILGIDFPVSIYATKLTAVTDKDTYEYDSSVLEFDSGNQTVFAKQTENITEGETLQKIGIQYTENRSGDFIFGWFLGIHFLKFLGYTFRKHWDVMEDWGGADVHGEGSWANTTITNTAGSTSDTDIEIEYIGISMEHDGNV